MSGHPSDPVGRETFCGEPPSVVRGRSRWKALSTAIPKWHELLTSDGEARGHIGCRSEHEPRDEDARAIFAGVMTRSGGGRPWSSGGFDGFDARIDNAAVVDAHQ